MGSLVNAAARGDGGHAEWISLASIAFAAVRAAAFSIAGLAGSVPAAASAYLIAIVGIQGRLLCNLFDGMVAFEGGRKTRSGEIFNELPDRIADSLIFVGAGFSSGLNGWLPHLGWGAAVMALIVAYYPDPGGRGGSRSVLSRADGQAALDGCSDWSDVSWRLPSLLGVGVARSWRRLWDW